MVLRPTLVLLGLSLVLPAAALPGQPDGRANGDPYADYGTLLARYVRDGEVDYARWKADAPPSWDSFLVWLETADPAAWPLADQQAFWINAYNARVIEGGEGCGASSVDGSTRWPGVTGRWMRSRRRSSSSRRFGTRPSTGP